MLGLLLIYFVGKAFYDLAKDHGKSPWGFGILGVVSYYVGLFFGGIIVAIIVDILAPGSIDDMPDLALGAMALPIGVVTCWLTYKLLKNNWTKPRTIGNETLDAGLINTEPEKYNQDER